MGHGGVLVDSESGRARRSSGDPRLHGGGCCGGTSDSRSSRGATRSRARVILGASGACLFFSLFFKKRLRPHSHNPTRVRLV